MVDSLGRRSSSEILKGEEKLFSAVGMKIEVVYMLGKKYVRYNRIVCNECPKKEEVNQTRLTFGGGNLKIDIDCGTPTASLLTTKLLLNSIISTLGTQLLGLDLNDFYLNTLVNQPYIFCIKLSNFSEDVINTTN